MTEEYIVRVLANDDCITMGELIRCKDCKYWSKDKRRGEVGRCFGREHQWAMHGDGYCSDAERKEEWTK